MIGQRDIHDRDVEQQHEDAVHTAVRVHHLRAMAVSLPTHMILMTDSVYAYS